MIKTLYVDFDGVIVNTVKCITELYNEDHKYYEKFSPVDWTSIDTWRFEELYLEPYSVIDRYFNQPRFFATVEWMDNAQEVLQRLSEKYEIKVVSMGNHENLVGKQIWLLKNMPYAKFMPVSFGEHVDKSDVDMSDGIIIDDSVSNLINSNAAKKVCFGDEYSWNKNWTGVRCNNWYDLENYLHEEELKIDQD